jgi:hypothetical protein
MNVECRDIFRSSLFNERSIEPSRSVPLEFVPIIRACFGGKCGRPGCRSKNQGFRQKLAPMISRADTRHEVQTRALPAPGAAYELHGLQAAGPKAPITDLSNPDCEVLGGGHRSNRGAKAFMGSSLPPRRNVCAGSGKCAVVRVALSYVAQGPKVCRLSAGGRWIRTSSTRAR